MSHTPNFDAKVRSILDVLVPVEKTCELTGRRWMMDEEEIKWYRHFHVPPSKREPLARTQLRASFWTGFQWWNHKHPVSGKTIVSNIHPATGIKVLPDAEWHAQDFSEINSDYNVDQSFFDQLHALQLRVPHPASRNAVEPENSIATVSMGDRNSYFVLGCSSEDSLYSIWADKLSHSSEVNFAAVVSDSYSVNNAKNVHGSLFVRESKDVIKSAFVFLCDDVEYCFGATNKSHKKFIFFNQQLTEAEFKAEMAKIDLSRRDQLQKYIDRFRDLVGNQTIWPETLSNRNSNVTGEYNYDCRDLTQCYGCVANCANLYWCNYGVDGRDSAFSTPVKSSECYEGDNTYNSHDIKFCYASYRSKSLEYCLMNYDCEYCFGCVGLRHKKFHIFNKPYEEADYWRRVDELKCAMLDRGEYGNFFPLSLSTAYFGESGGVMYYDADPSLNKTFGGLEYEPESAGAIGDLAQAMDVKKTTDVPNCIDDVKDEEWVGVPVLDAKHNRRFAFLKPEMDFYRRKKLAPPTEHFVYRIKQLSWEGNLGILEPNTCAKCGKQIQVAKNLTYPNRKIYCMEDYLRYIEETT